MNCLTGCVLLFGGDCRAGLVGVVRQQPRRDCVRRAVRGSVPAALVLTDDGGAVVRARDAGGGRRCRSSGWSPAATASFRHRQRGADCRPRGHRVSDGTAGSTATGCRCTARARSTSRSTSSSEGPRRGSISRGVIGSRVPHSNAALARLVRLRRGREDRPGGQGVTPMTSCVHETALPSPDEHHTTASTSPGGAGP